jgi:hypothetical protein
MLLLFIPQNTKKSMMMKLKEREAVWQFVFMLKLMLTTSWQRNNGLLIFFI